MLAQFGSGWVVTKNGKRTKPFIPQKRFRWFVQAVSRSAYAFQANGRIQLLLFPWRGLRPSPFRHGSLAAWRAASEHCLLFHLRTASSRKPRIPAELLDNFVQLAGRFDRNLSLDSVLLTVKAREPERFEECLRFVNLALGHRGKRITGFGENGRLVVDGESESGKRYQHPVEELSSGEKQMLLMLGFTIAFLRPGGILLIDEPTCMSIND